MNTFQTSCAGERMQRALQPEAVAHLGGWDVSAGLCMIHFLTSDAVQMSRPKPFWARFDELQWPAEVILSLCKDSNILSNIPGGSRLTRCRQEAFTIMCLNIRG